MKHKITLKNGKYYRINSDNSLTEVSFKDGYFYWTNPEGKKVRTKIDNVEIPKSFMSKLGEIFTNSTMSAANADVPAVTTASGWRRHGNNWNLNEINSQASLLLRKNLAVLSTMAYAPTASAATKLVAPGTTGGNAVGTAAGSMAIGTGLEEAERAISGQSLGDMASSRLQKAGVWPVIADMARPEYYFDPTGLVAKSFLSALSTPIKLSSKLAPKPRKVLGVERISTVEAPINTLGLEDILSDASSNNIRLTLDRLRGEPVDLSAIRTDATPRWQAAADVFRNSRYTEERPGVFYRWGLRYDLTGDNPKLWAIRDNLLEELDLLNPSNAEDIVHSRVRPIRQEVAEAYQKYPYMLQYRREGNPYTIDNIPGLDRTDLVEVGGGPYDLQDKAGMGHFSGEQILDNEGHLVGNKVNGATDYTQLMMDEFKSTPHGASVGFNHDGATSTSSTPMFWRQLDRMLSNNSIARVYSPLNGSRYSLNLMGRAYVLDKRGRMRQIPGTEGRDFRIPYEPQYKGAKTIKHTSADGSQREIVLLPDGTYLKDRFNSTNDINEAMNGYYHNGMIYQIDPIGKHSVVVAVDLPTVTPELYVDWLNQNFIMPVAKKAKLNIEPAKATSNSMFPVEVPSIAGIVFKEGGPIEKFKRNRKICKKN